MAGRSPHLHLVDDPSVYTVSELLREINGLFRGHYAEIAVEGEVTNFKRATSGHCYFAIKDAEATLRITLFSTYARSVRFRIEDGLKVVVRGRVEVYAPRGEMQMRATAVDPAGIGALALAFEQLKQKLSAEGLFDEARKRPIPGLPTRIAIVTSPTGAAVRDVLNVLRRRFDGLHIQIFPVRVQGAGAAAEIAQAIRCLSRWKRHDVVLVVRGGGSIEDLWAFNEEVVARALAECAIPTISGVGHEPDFTICDFVADLRAPTPSAAAEIVIRERGEICRQIDASVETIRRLVERRIERIDRRLDELSGPRGLLRFESRVTALRSSLQRHRLSLRHGLERHERTMRARLERADRTLATVPARLAVPSRHAAIRSLRGRLDRAMRDATRTRRRALVGRIGTLEAVSPLSVLSRGYAIAFHTRKGRRRKPILDSAQVEIGDPIEVQVKRGRLLCTVDGRSMGVESLWPEIDMNGVADPTRDDERED